jgi:hypothetical protein
MMNSSKIRISEYGTAKPTKAIAVRCPSCNHFGTLEPFENVRDVTLGNSPVPVVIGQRRCPNLSCQSHVFFVQKNGEVVSLFPPSTIDFDPTNIPSRIVDSLREAIVCHANACYTAAAIMVRKALEEFCSDCGAQGKNLKARILDLRTRIVLPQELFDGIDDLRLLGNDAAHLESQEFNKVDKEEVEVSLEFTKEVLKARYQYASLLEKIKRLKAPKDVTA